MTKMNDSVNRKYFSILWRKRTQKKQLSKVYPIKAQLKHFNDVLKGKKKEKFGSDEYNLYVCLK